MNRYINMLTRIPLRLSLDHPKDVFFGRESNLITFNPETFHILKLRFRKFEAARRLQKKPFCNRFRIKAPKVNGIDKIFSLNSNENVKLDNCCHNVKILINILKCLPSARILLIRHSGIWRTSGLTGHPTWDYGTQ